ncbi:hypothetical protein BIZ37_14800 [Photobacterium sp. BZF1]|uniref:hypothetical protein n=1 Tax=Photobacterium sp. BZF1 TaxID=1904457 RepID=UPI001653D1FE|nr:hypothetical protein [Photobacterium sp. BZF1]MBC7003829.1 hypothetical protein [Photobacterium sp. BZF1]
MSELNDLKKRDIRVGYDRGNLVVEVLTLGWRGPHTPVEKWVVAETIPCCMTPITFDIDNPRIPVIVPPNGEPTQEEGIIGTSVFAVEEAIERVLNGGKYFGHCKHCNDYFQAGYMFMEERCCHGCAHVHLGIVF